MSFSASRPILHSITHHNTHKTSQENAPHCDKATADSLCKTRTRWHAVTVVTFQMLCDAVAVQQKNMRRRNGFFFIKNTTDTVCSGRNTSDTI